MLKNNAFSLVNVCMLFLVHFNKSWIANRFRIWKNQPWRDSRSRRECVHFNQERIWNYSVERQS